MEDLASHWWGEGGKPLATDPGTPFLASRSWRLHIPSFPSSQFLCSQGCPNEGHLNLRLLTKVLGNWQGAWQRGLGAGDSKMNPTRFPDSVHRLVMQLYP